MASAAVPCVFITSPACQRHITANATEEIKFDGFRALAHVENGKCRLVSRRNHEYKSFHELCASIAAHLHGSTAVLDGEIVCLDQFGRSQFYELMFRRGQPFFYAFDLLWLNGEDLRPLAFTDLMNRALDKPAAQMQVTGDDRGPIVISWLDREDGDAR